MLPADFGDVSTTRTCCSAERPCTWNFGQGFQLANLVLLQRQKAIPAVLQLQALRHSILPHTRAFCCVLGILPQAGRAHDWAGRAWL